MNKSWVDFLGGAGVQEGISEALEYSTKRRKKGYIVYPDSVFLFNAFELTSPESANVVILGQDPYHGPGQANGLAFSVPAGQKPPPSLRNILTEAGALGRQSGGDLSSWAGQGVLLLNTILTVEQSKPGSHAGQGWEQFTDLVISSLSSARDNIVFMLWGSKSRQKVDLIDASKHLILEAPHPSPLSAYRGFISCGHFGVCNDYLASHGKQPIDWSS